MAAGSARWLRWSVPFACAAAASACSLLVDTGGLAGSPLDAGGEAGAETSLPDASVDARVGTDAATPADLYRAAVLADRPIAYWTFDEAASATGARDIVGGKTAEVSGGSVGFGAGGIAGTAVGLDRTGLLDVGDVLDLRGSTAYAFEVWLKPRVGNDVFYEFLKKRTSSDNGYVCYVRRDGSDLNVQWEHGSASGNRGTMMFIALDTWQHVVVTYDGGDGMHLFVNGNRDKSSYAEATANATDNGASLLIGSSFLGTIDELAVYDHALALDRIRAHFALGKP